MPEDSGNIIEQVVIEIVGKAENFLDKVEDSVEQAKSAFQRLVTDQQQVSEQLEFNMFFVKEFAELIRQPYEEAARRLVETGNLSQEAADQAVQGLRDMEKQAAKTSVAMKTLQKWAKLILRAFFGLSALSILRNLAQIFKDASEKAQELGFAEFRLAVGVRAAQRRIGEQIGTMEEWEATIDRLKQQFSIFSRKDITDAVAKVLLLTRELGFNKEQIDQVVTASIALAEVTGKTVEDAARRLALFLDTGYSRGLAQLGIQVTTSTVQHSEYARQLGKTWEEMNRGERAAVSLAVVMDQVAPILDDAGRAADTFQGKMQTLEAGMTDTLAELGEKTASLVLMWQTIKNFFVANVIGPIFDAAQALVQLFSILIIIATKAFTFLYVAIDKVEQAIVDFDYTIKEAMDDALAVSEEAAGIMAQRLSEFFPEDFGEDVGDQMGALADSLELGADAAEEYDERVEKALQDVAEEAVRTGQRLSDAWDDYIRDLEDLTIEFEQDLIDLRTDLDRELGKIERSFADNIAKAQLDLQRKLQDIAIDTNQKIADAQRDFRRQELKAQEEFNVKLRRLNEDYAINIQDAVRERDARQVLDLLQQKTIDTNRAIEDFEIARQQRLEAYKQEIADIKLQAARKRQEAKLEFERRLQDEEIRRQISRREAQISYAEDLEDLQLHNQRMREEAWRDYQRRIEDLAKYLQQRIEILAFALQQEFNLTAEALQLLLDMMAQVIGESGIAIQMFQGALAGMNATYAGALGDTFGGGGYQGPPGMAEGGVAVADQPTTVTFGEAGKELAAFLPLDKLGGQNPLFGAGAKEGGKAQITVSLDDGLVADIVDQSLGEVADIFVEMNE